MTLDWVIGGTEALDKGLREVTVTTAVLASE